MASTIFERLPLWQESVPTICIHCDNQAAISRTQNFIYNGKSRHIRHRHNTVKQLLSNGIISIDIVSSKDNLVDPLYQRFKWRAYKLRIEGNESKSLTLPSQLNGNLT